MNTHNIIEIQEYQSQVIENLNEDSDIAYLEKPCFKDRESAPYKLSRGVRDNKLKIENTSYSGIIQLDKIRIHFSTKVKTNLFYMLSFLKDERYFFYDPEKIIEIEEGQSFYDILGRLFLNELEEIYKRGFYKKYVRKEENVSYIKGKLKIRGQLQNDIRKMPKFFCSYGDLTYDNMENRIVLRAATLLIPLIRFNEDVKRELLRYSILMREEVSLVDVAPEDCNKIQFSRLNEHYETIIQLSKVILQSHFIRYIHKGASKGFNFIVNMNKVYEDFITTIIGELIEEDNDFRGFIVADQMRFNSLVKEQSIGVRPDIILKKKDTDEYPFIIDAKYKRQENNADFYQVIAYALAIPTAKSCCLIYPSEADIDTQTLTIDTESFGNKRENIPLHICKINLSWDRKIEFKQFIQEIKDEVKAKVLVKL